MSAIDLHRLKTRAISWLSAIRPAISEILKPSLKPQPINAAFHERVIRETRGLTPQDVVLKTAEIYRQAGHSGTAKLIAGQLAGPA